MNSSGNGPTVISVAPDTYAAHEENGEVAEESAGAVVKGAMQNLFSRKSKREVDREEATSTPPQSFESKLDEWVRASKPDEDRFQLVLWWLYVILHLHKTKMQPPQKVSRFKLRKVIDATIAAINFVREESAAIVAVIATKGGVGKTTVSTWIAAVMAGATKLSVAVVDTDRGGGLVASRFGLSKVRTSSGEIKRPLSIYQLGKRIATGEVFTPEKLIKETLSDSKTGVMIFRAPAAQGMGVERTSQMLRHVRAQYAGGMVVDSTPGVRVPMTNAAAVTSDVKIIVAQGLSDESIQGVRTALNFAPYELRGAIQRVLVVIVALPVRKCTSRTAYELIDHLNLRPVTEAESATGEAGDDDDPEEEMVDVSADARLQPSQILFLPTDRYMDNHKVKELEPVLFEAVRPRTRLALAQLVKAKDEIVLQFKAATPQTAHKEDVKPPMQFRRRASV